VCAKAYDYSDTAWRCHCGGALSLGAPAPFQGSVPGVGIWRFSRNLPPVSEDERVSLGEGCTPLAPVRGIPGETYAKLEFASPTGSFKDRGTAVVVTRLRAIGVPQVVDDSSGNAGASLAAYCAVAGIRCSIYAPADTSPSKLAQIHAYGAEVVRVPGPRAAATEAALVGAAGAYYANHVWDPYFFEGTKTAAFEIVEQLGGRAPARVVLPVGQGTMLLGLARGFGELRAAGRIPHLPELIAVQSAACAPLYEVLHHGLRELPVIAPPQRMLAEGIATVSPLRWRAIIEAVRASGGTVVRVPEVDIPGALARLGQAGLFVEPTAATPLVAVDQLVSAQGGALPGVTVLVLTGSGLKAAVLVAELLDSISRDVPPEGSDRDARAGFPAR
jgi:threonine synthase